MARQARYLDLSAELDLRKLRYFLAVAHHLNFGRAAEELLLAQPALSRAIRALEADLGVALFERDHHKVTITAAGAVLVREAETLLARAAASRRRVLAASRGASTLTIGFRPGIIIPIAGADLVITPLFDDAEVVALPAAHHLAESDSVSLADLANEPMLRYDTAPEHEAGRRSANRGIRTMEEKLEAVALGHGLALVPATAAAYYQRPDIAYRPVTDAPPYQVALATTTDTAQRPDAQAFVTTALAVSARNAANRAGVPAPDEPAGPAGAPGSSG
jgi:DNA-binding transcriptional LysR family regulator